MDVDTSMLAMVNFIMSDYRVTISPDLDASQGVAINIIMFNQPPTFSEDINTSLEWNQKD